MLGIFRPQRLKIWQVGNTDCIPGANNDKEWVGANCYVCGDFQPIHGNSSA